MAVVINEELVGFLAYYGAILMVKLFMMVVFTARARSAKGVYATPEDLKMFGEHTKVNPTDPDVERVRLAHRNDLENILPFFFISIFYLTTNPSVFLAKMLIRTFTFARITHTIVYINAIPQPARGLSFFTALLVLIYMTFSVLWHYA